MFFLTLNISTVFNWFFFRLILVFLILAFLISGVIAGAIQESENKLKSTEKQNKEKKNGNIETC